MKALFRRIKAKDGKNVSRQITRRFDKNKIKDCVEI